MSSSLTVQLPQRVRTGHRTHRYIDDHKRLAWRFNPTYGQGMSVAALDALIRRRHPRRGAERQPRRFFGSVPASTPSSVG
jgi:hypothetical protein